MKMVYFNGDRVCLRYKTTPKVEFGRVQEYVDVEESNFNPSSELSNYGDVLCMDDTLFSSTTTTTSCVSPPPLGSDGGRSLKRIPLLHLLSPSKTEKKSFSFMSMLGMTGDGNNEAQLIPGLTSPIMMKRSKSQPDLIGYIRNDSDSKKIKRQIIWDNNNKKDTEITGKKDEEKYRVIDRKFSVGQCVTLDGRSGKVIEVVPRATVYVPYIQPENKQEIAHVIPDLNIAEILPISSIFSGVTIEFQGWLGQVNDVQRRVIYKLDDSTYLTRTFKDSELSRNYRNAPSQSDATASSSTSPLQSATKKVERSIQNHFSYPFLPNYCEMPFTGKVEKFSKLRLQQLKLEEEDDKENSSPRYATRSKMGSGSSSSTVCMELRKRNRTERGDFITAIVESVSIVSIKVRWTGRLPAYLIKLQSTELGTKEKGQRNVAGAPTRQKQQQVNYEIPPTFIRSTEDIKQVRPLYINPAMYFEKKGLCAYITDQKDEKILIPERKWSYDLCKDAESINNGSEVTFTAPFNLSSVTLSPTSSSEKGKDSASSKDTDDYNNNKVKRKRCHDEQETRHEQESSARRTVIVCKHFVRHMYKVIWDEKEGDGKRRNLFSCFGEDFKGKSCSNNNSNNSQFGMYWGTDLHPVTTQEHKLCLGLIHSHLYVLPRPNSCMYGQCDYGVVVEKPADDSVVVEWLKIQKDGNVSTVRILKSGLFDIEKHPAFNELHEGRVVVRGKNADAYRCTREFRFGTIVRINRFALGQILVYCPIQKKTVELWPHMIELFVGMSMKEQIALKIIGRSTNTGLANGNENKNK